ncbi:MAG: hypothetical protein HQL24_09535 [Candidatus Omnitrophica bacterium]|nr:hypothetical protein [Candidatus Omnitrophota bacterium]
MAVSAAKNYYNTITSLERQTEAVKSFMARTRGEGGKSLAADGNQKKIVGMLQNGKFTDLKWMSDTFDFTV